MLTNRIFWILFLFFFFKPCIAEESLDAIKPKMDFSFALELMGGISYNLNEDNYNSKKLGITPSVRILWMPDNRLNFGFETSYLLLRKTDKEKNKQVLKGRLEAVPVLLLFNMNVLAIDLTFGLGVSYMQSTINAYNVTSIANQWHYCFNFGAGFSFKISSRLDSGIEGKIYSLTKTDELISTAYLKFRYHFLY